MIHSIKRAFTITFLLMGCLFLNASCSDDKEKDTNSLLDELWYDPITVGTYNIQYDNLNDKENTWERRNKILEPLLKELDFDIFGSQEPYIHQIEDILEYMPGYAFIGKDITGQEGIPRKHYVPIFYKKDRFEVMKEGMFWLSETPNVPNSKGWDAYSVRVCVWAQFKDLETGKEFYHFNTHFDHIGLQAKQESAKLLIKKIEEIAGSEPCFVTGDFNSNQKTVAFNTLVTSNVITDSRNKAEKRVNENWHTWNDYKVVVSPPANATRIDHVFVSEKGGTRIKHWEIVNKDIGGKYPSDHFPIVIKWCLRK